MLTHIFASFIILLSHIAMPTDKSSQATTHARPTSPMQVFRMELVWLSKCVGSGGPFHGNWNAFTLTQWPKMQIQLAFIKILRNCTSLKITYHNDPGNSNVLKENSGRNFWYLFSGIMFCTHVQLQLFLSYLQEVMATHIFISEARCTFQLRMIVNQDSQCVGQRKTTISAKYTRFRFAKITAGVFLWVST